MDKQQEQINYYRGRIQEMLKRVPASVNAGTYDRAVAFKKTASEATKAASSGRPNLGALIDAHNRLSSYY